jgi:hypothetical protein
VILTVLTVDIAMAAIKTVSAMKHFGLPEIQISIGCLDDVPEIFET